MNPKVSIIILNWNSADDTIECVRSVQEVTYPNFDVVIVDNGSTDRSEKNLRNAFPEIRIIQTGSNLGYAGGNNIGIRHALGNKADYVLLLNNDTIVARDFLDKLVLEAESSDKIGISAPVIYHYDDPGKISFAGGKIEFFTGRSRHITEPMDNPEFLTGTCLLIKREVIKKIGLLTEKFFLYMEDVDYSFKVRKAGFKLKVVRNSKIWHKISSTTGPNYKPANIYYLVRNNLSFISEHFPKPNKFVMFFGFSLVCFKIILNPFLKKYPYKTETFLSVIRGYRNFLLGKYGPY